MIKTLLLKLKNFFLNLGGNSNDENKKLLIKDNLLDDSNNPERTIEKQVKEVENLEEAKEEKIEKVKKVKKAKTTKKANIRKQSHGFKKEAKVNKARKNCRR